MRGVGNGVGGVGDGVGGVCGITVGRGVVGVTVGVGDDRGVVVVTVVGSRSKLVNTLFIIVNARLDIGNIPKASRSSFNVWILALIVCAVGLCAGLAFVICVNRSEKFRSQILRLFNLGAKSFMVTPIA